MKIMRDGSSTFARLNERYSKFSKCNPKKTKFKKM